MADRQSDDVSQNRQALKPQDAVNMMSMESHGGRPSQDNDHSNNNLNSPNPTTSHTSNSKPLTISADDVGAVVSGSAAKTDNDNNDDLSSSLTIAGAPNPTPDVGNTSTASAITTAAPLCAITLLLQSGARHPYHVDEKYLTKRGVEIPGVTAEGHRDPTSISVYKLKELILREWRDEWDPKPASPTSIRLIFFGKIMDDKEMLNKYNLNPDMPNVIHMSVKPAEMMEEDEAAKSKPNSREHRSRSGGGCCVIL